MAEEIKDWSDVGDFRKKQDWQRAKDIANIGASGIAKAAEWALAGGMHGSKKGMPIAPIDEWEGELTKPSTWDLDPGDQYGPIDFWRSWKPDLGDIPGELAHFLRPFPQPAKYAPEWLKESWMNPKSDLAPEGWMNLDFPELGELWKKNLNLYPFYGSTGDQFGLAGVGNFEKNPAYSELQQKLISGSGPDSYDKIIPNPLYHNMSQEDFYGLQHANLGSYANYFQSSPYLPEGAFNHLIENGIFSDGDKKEGFFIDRDVFDSKKNG